MKKQLITSLGLSVLAISLNTQAASAELKTVEQKASYTLGMDIANNLRKQGLDVDANALTQGLRDALANKPSRLSEEEMLNSINEIKQRMQSKQLAQQEKVASNNLAAGEKFLADNAKKPGIKTLEKGVQYKVLSEGKGKSPTTDDTIFAHYAGRLINGKEFDSSYKRGAPLEFKMHNVIAGWGIALKHMKPGSKWEVYIPADQAYGARGAGNAIGPNETLIFTIELIQFKQDES